MRLALESDGLSWSWLRIRPEVTTEALALAASLFFAVACNTAFIHAVTADRSWSDTGTWLFGGAMLLMLTALHLFLLLLVLHRRFAQPLLSVLIIATAFTTYYMQRFGVFLNPSMLRTVFRTDVAEAGELFSWGMLPHLLLYAALPLALLWRLQVKQRTMVGALIARAATLGGALAVLVGSVLLVFQDFSVLMRNQKDLRYLITPANYLYSSARVLAADTRQAGKPRAVVGADARLAASWAARTRPALVVIAVGETARAANWGLSVLTPTEN